MTKRNNKRAVNYYLYSNQIVKLQQLLENPLLSSKSNLIVRFIDIFMKLKSSEVKHIFELSRKHHVFAMSEKTYSSAFIPDMQQEFISRISTQFGIGKAEVLTTIIWHALNLENLYL